MSVSAWVADRVPTDLLHFDVAGAGRLSHAVLDAEVEHLRREQQVGAYVAEAAADLTAGRTALGAMVGLGAPDIFFSDGASTAFATVLDAWPLRAGARIGTLPSEYGGNARVLADRAKARGWVLVPLPVDALGRVLEVPADLDLVTFPQVPSQRGIAQPVEEVLASGVPLLLDVAQAVGQVAVPSGAAAYVGTARKWLCGPRGVGFGVVAPQWQDRLAPAPTLRYLEAEAMARYDAAEPHVAGRVALALAARTWSPALLPVIGSAAGAARVLLEGAGGWRVIEPHDEPTGITTLVHDSADAVATRAALLADGILVNAVPRHRSADLSGPVLRVSTAAWVTPGDLEALAAALDRRTGR